MNKMKIFTFWEPVDKMPAYIKLCIDTWHKYLPECEVVLLDYSNLSKYIDISVYGQNFNQKNFSLAQIADAIRCLVLYEHGGIWLDADTILKSSDVLNYFNREGDVFFGNKTNRTVHIGVIKSNPKSKLMKFWVDGCKKRIEDFNKLDPHKKILGGGWNYLGNAIIDDYISRDDEIIIYDATDEGVTPEKKLNYYYINSTKAYIDFYFDSSIPVDRLESSMIMLHNSWTPNEFKVMSKEEFLYCNCTLSNILSSTLGIMCYKVNDFNLIKIKNIAQRVNEINDKVVCCEDRETLYKEFYAYSNRLSIYTAYYLLKTFRSLMMLFACRFIESEYQQSVKKVKLIRDFKRKANNAKK